ncbi:MAG TPA: hypothetical protein VFN61_12955 [Acidimicrobiales bacterium]|nr:hypothetical protein [Acidimicrobiales bacterium]
MTLSRTGFAAVLRLSTQARAGARAVPHIGVDREMGRRHRNSSAQPPGTARRAPGIQLLALASRKAEPPVRSGVAKTPMA